MNFNPDPTNKITFSLKAKKLPHAPLVLHNANVTQSIYQKHLELTFETI